MRLVALMLPASGRKIQRKLSGTHGREYFEKNIRDVHLELWRTHSCVPLRTRANAWTMRRDLTRRSHECERGTQECVRHGSQ